MPASDVAELLAAYNDQLRARVPDPLPERMQADHDGPLVRFVFPRGGMIGYRDLAGLAGVELDALIERQIAHFGALGGGARDR